MTDLQSLGEALGNLEGNPSKFVIRGQLICGRSCSGVRRLLKPQGGVPATFEACPREWCMIDIDELPLPSDVDDFRANKERLVSIAIAHLPPEFATVDCWYQFSGSMGVKTNRIRLHLWFWLDRPVRDNELKAWLQGYPVDLAVYNAVQPHYTAAPVLADGVCDPMPDRSGFYRAGRQVTTVTVPDEFEVAPTSASATRRGRAGRPAGFSGTRIVRDPNTNLVVDGRRMFLLQASNKATTAVVKAGQAEKIAVEELAQMTWAVFSKGADISDGKWSVLDAMVEAEQRLEKLRTGTYDFTSRQDATTLYPTHAPSIAPAFVDRETGMKALGEALTRFFSNLSEREPRLALRVTMGAGKTRQVIEHLKAFLAGRFGMRIEIYVPRHDLAAEYVEKLKAGVPVAAKVVHVVPRDGGSSGNLPILCRRADYVKSLRKSGVGIFHKACRSADGQHCEFYDACGYIEQFRDPSLATAQGNVVRIGVHSYLGLPRNPIQNDPDLVIIDEAFLNDLIKEELVRLTDIRRHIKTPRHPNIGALFADALVTGQPLLQSLQTAGVVPTDLGDVELNHLRPPAPFMAAGNKPVTLPSATLHRSLSVLLEVLREELSLKNRTQVERVIYDPRTDEAVIVRLHSPEIPDNVPLLILDATGDQDLLEEIVGPVEFRTIDIEQRAFTTQVYDRTGSNSFWNGDTAPVADLVSILNVWARLGEHPLLISHKKLADQLRERSDLDESVMVNHFQNVRGSNAAEHASAVFITGRNSPPAWTIDIKARAVFWAADQPLCHDEASFLPATGTALPRLPTVLRGYLQSGANPHPQSGVEVRSFTDERIEALHRQSREAETIQAIARLRLVHAPFVKNVILLGNLPVEMPVDQFVRFDELMPDRLEIELIRKGNVPLSAAGLLRMRPDLATNAPQAKKMLQRSRVKDPSRLRALPILSQTGLLVIEFKATNAGRTATHQHLFILLNQQAERLPAASSINLSAGHIPFADWVAYLENGDPEIPGSGWSGVHQPRLLWA
ncbi:hypothetical protein [uncultured Paracoccus sp.]|uniref:hypothetical protein n=2 Tax=Paracoccus TaxID=265 RepID=UPI0030DC7260